MLLVNTLLRSAIYLFVSLHMAGCRNDVQNEKGMARLKRHDD